jgi:hypothetical protein
LPSVTVGNDGKVTKSLDRSVPLLYHSRTMARRKITQRQANQIRKRYEALIRGESQETIDDIRADFGNIARTTIYGLRDKGWDIMAEPNRSGKSMDQIALLEQAIDSLLERVEHLENDNRRLWKMMEQAGSNNPSPAKRS